MDVNSIYSDLEAESQENYEFNVAENFAQFLTIIKTNLGKRRYKKVYEEIISVSHGIFNSLTDFWKLTEYKIEAMLKIIQKKLNKYASGNKKTIYPLKSIDVWFRESSDVLETWSEEIFALQDNEEQLNSYIYYTLNEIYLHAMHLKNQSRFFEMTSMLSIAEKLIREFVNKCTKPKTLNMCQKVFLLISSLMISDNNYETAKLYQYYAMQLIVKEMFYRSDNEDKLYTDTYDAGEQHGIRSMFVNFSIVFYQRGVCEENLCKLDKAVECYRQSNWAAKKFLRAKVPEFVQFLHYLEDKMFKYRDLLRTLLKESKQRELQKEINQQALKRVGKESIDEKYDKIRENVEKVVKRIPDTPCDNQEKEESPKKYIMSTVNIVNKMLSKDYRGVVKGANEIKLFDMDKELKEKLKKQMSHLRITKLFNERAKELFGGKGEYPTLIDLYKLIKLKNEKKKTRIEDIEEPAMKKKSFLQVAIDKIKARSKSVLSVVDGDTTPTTTPITIRHNRAQSVIEVSPTKRTGSPAKSSLSPRKSFARSNSVGLFVLSKGDETISVIKKKEQKEQKNDVKKIEHEDYIFSKKFKKKYDYLYHVEKKEITFQKKLLNLKKFEKIPYELKDDIEIEQDIEHFFANTIKTKIINHIENNNEKLVLTSIRSVNPDRIKKTKKLERETIMSLNSKKYLEYAHYLKKKESMVIGLSDEFRPASSNVSASDKLPTKEIEKMRNNILNDLNKKLEYIEEKQHKCLKVMNPSQYKQRPYSQRKSVTKVEKPIKAMDEFVKFTTPVHYRLSMYNGFHSSFNKKL
jgi:hypothetical protein